MKKYSSVLCILFVLLWLYSCNYHSVSSVSNSNINKKTIAKPTVTVNQVESKEENNGSNSIITSTPTPSLIPSETPIPSIIPDNSNSSSGSGSGGGYIGNVNSTGSSRPSYTISGLVDFPKQGKNNITVALIDFSNQTLSTSVTDSNGRFIINPDSSFFPANGSIYILEAQKRVSGTGSFVITERSYIRWNSAAWESITTPSIQINSKTTAMMLIGKSLVNNEALVGKLDISNGGTSTLAEISQSNLDSVDTLVKTVIEAGRDPFDLIKSKGNSFYIDKSFELNTLLATNACIGCDFTGADLTNIDFSNKDLSNSVLSKMNLSKLNFSNSNLSGVDLSFSNIANADLSTVTSMQKVNCTNAYMSGVNLTGRNLSASNLTFSYLANANLSNADLSYSDLTNATLTNANLSNANLKGANLSGVDLSTVNKTGAQF